MGTKTLTTCVPKVKRPTAKLNFDTTVANIYLDAGHQAERARCKALDPAACDADNGCEQLKNLKGAYVGPTEGTECDVDSGVCYGVNTPGNPVKYSVMRPLTTS